MKVVRTIGALRRRIDYEKKRDRSIGFVPTLGDLHEGHFALVRRARKENDYVVISIFVNPIQFNEKRDYFLYRRHPRKDRKSARAVGADLIFLPSVHEMYPAHFSTRVREEDLSQGLCGARRQGHFEGVTTVVTKLFNIISPDRAYFGQKDAQQTAIVKRVVRDLNFRVKVCTVPTVRGRGGLARSSRNGRLTSAGHEKAVRLWQSLKDAKRRVREGEKRPSVIRARIRSALKGPGLRLEYVDIVDPVTFERLGRIRRKALIAVCLWVDRVRLIDNVIASR